MPHEPAHDCERVPSPGEEGHERPSLTVDVASMFAPGSRFARYEIVRCVGVGGMGAVFEAIHVQLRKRVALKTQHTSLSQSEPARQRFVREAETVARIQHPNVVDITDVGVENDVPYFVMEFLEGEDLARRLERGQLRPREAADIVVPLVSGLAAVHRLGIVHRDIKPENVFLAQGARLGGVTPKLVDFGVSKDLIESSRSGVPPLHTVTGTPHYMSPEQARGSAMLDTRSDQYALGVLLYQSMTDTRPYDASSLLELMHLIDEGAFRPLRDLAPEVPEELERVVHRAMSRNPDARFETTEAFGEALLPFASERIRVTYAEDFAVKPTPFVAPSPRPKTSHDAELSTVPTLQAVAVLAVPDGSQSGIRARGNGGEMRGALQRTQSDNAGIESAQRASRPSLFDPPTTKKHKLSLVVMGGVVMALLLLALAFVWGVPPGPKAPATEAAQTPEALKAKAPFATPSAADSHEKALTERGHDSTGGPDASTKTAASERSASEPSASERSASERDARSSLRRLRGSKAAEEPPVLLPVIQEPAPAPLDIQLSR